MRDLNGDKDHPETSKKQGASSADFTSSRKLANEALGLADTYLTPPFPRAYEVLYTYASGKDGQITERVDAAIDGSGELNSYEVDQIHQEFLSPLGKRAEQQDTSSEKLKQELDAIMQLIQVHLETNEGYSGSLDKSIENLSDASSPNEVRGIVEVLISENRKMQGETRRLNEQLEKSREQVHEMRKELVEARENEMRDPVTNLGNRRWFEKNLLMHIEKAKGSESDLCLALVDIDHFKKTNDTFGHLAGDQVLRYFGSLLQKNIKGKDVCARYGGEEFAIILPDTKLDHARKLVDNIRVKFEKSRLVFTKSKRPLGEITASFGLVRAKPDDDPETIVQRADTRLYEAKNSGRNKVVCDES